MQRLYNFDHWRNSFALDTLFFFLGGEVNEPKRLWFLIQHQTAQLGPAIFSESAVERAPQCCDCDIGKLEAEFGS